MSYVDVLTHTPIKSICQWVDPLANGALFTVGSTHPPIAHRPTLDRPIHQSIAEWFNRTSSDSIVNEIQITNHISESKHRDMCLHQPPIPTYSSLPAPNYLYMHIALGPNYILAYSSLPAPNSMCTYRLPAICPLPLQTICPCLLPAPTFNYMPVPAPSSHS